MKATDIRILDPETQFALRQQVITLREEGRSIGEIVKLTGVNRTHISTIWQKYRKGGVEAISPKTRGRRQGDGRNLSADQEGMLRNIILESTPRKLNLKDNLWTRNTVKQAANHEIGAELQLRTVTDYLRRWGFTLPKPALQSREHLSDDSVRWLDSVYPKLTDHALRGGAEILWFSDEVVQSSGLNARKTSETVSAGTCSARDIGMLSAGNNQGMTRFMFCEGSMTARIFIRFLSRLTRDVPRKIYLVMCVPPLHPGNELKAWLRRRNRKIELVYMPPYSQYLPRGRRRD